MPLPDSLAREIGVQPGDELDHVHKLLWDILWREIKKRYFKGSWPYDHPAAAKAVINTGLLALKKHPYDRDKGTTLGTWVNNYAWGRMIEAFNAEGTVTAKEIIETAEQGPAIYNGVDAGGGDIRERREGEGGSFQFSGAATGTRRFGDRSVSGRIDAGYTQEIETRNSAEGEVIDGVSYGRITREDNITQPFPFASGVESGESADPRDVPAPPRSGSTLQQWAQEIADKKKGRDSVLREKPADSRHIVAGKFGDTDKKWLPPIEQRDDDAEAVRKVYTKQHAVAEARKLAILEANRLGRIIDPSQLEHLRPIAYRIFWQSILALQQAGKLTAGKFKARQKKLFPKLRADAEEHAKTASRVWGYLMRGSIFDPHSGKGPGRRLLRPMREWRLFGLRRKKP